jgi:hypothetical protein
MYFRTVYTLENDMSIASTVTVLERANAAYKAAQASTTRVAKRGMFALVEREHRYSYLCGAHAGHVSYTPGSCRAWRVPSPGKRVSPGGRHR